MKRSTNVIVSNLSRNNILFSTFYTGLFLLFRKKLGRGGGGGPPLATALWKQDFTKPPLCQIRDNIWAIRGLLVIFFLAQNRSHYILPCLIFYGKFEVAEYWTRKRCNIVQLLKGKEVRMIFLFWSIQSLFLRRPCFV